MDDYEMITRLGGGSFADVYKALEKSTGELVAIKVLKRKYKKFDDSNELMECRSLQKLHNDSTHNKPGEENIIKLKHIIFIKKTGQLNLVFEYMETDLLELMKSCEPKTLKEDQIRDIMHQTLLGLSFMHKYGFFHRDMKPENLLLTRNKLKIADFGLAREIRSVPPYTEYVSTRYYRAPECILKSTNYNSPIDIWALGCIMAEMYLHPQPLFCGANEKEVLFKICSVLGTPTHDIWNDGIRQANIIGMKFPTCSGTDLEKIIPEASSEAIDLMKSMLKWDPNKRATAKNLLNHPFFTNHIIDNYFYSSGNNDIIFGENNFKKFSNSKERERGRKNEIKKSEKNEKESNNNSSNTGNENNINNFELGDDDNYGNMLNESDGFDKLLNQLKKEKIEEDKNYEKQKKQKEKEKEKSKLKEEEFDLNNLIDNFKDTNINKDNFESKETKNKNDDAGLFNRRKTEKKEINFYNDENKINKEQNNNNNYKSNQNRRGNARHFLEETENFGSFNFGESPKKKSNEINGNDNNSYLNKGNSGEFGSLFGNKSRRRPDKFYEI
jgi:serine/threonine protein kinase